MYVPASFEMHDRKIVAEFLRENSFAILVTHTGTEPTASHLPLLAEFDNGRLVLSGHFAKANPHVRVAADSTSLAIFHGPHAYVSPRFTPAQTNAVPTWNYLTVHAYGRVRFIDDAARTRALLFKMTAKYEGETPNAWTIDRPEASWIERLTEGIAAFEIIVDRWEAKWKLNRNHSRERREAIANELARSEYAHEREIAQAMRAAIERD